MMVVKLARWCVYTDADMHGRGGILSTGDDGKRSHKDVLERSLGGEPAFSAVFDQDTNGSSLWVDDVAPVARRPRRRRRGRRARLARRRRTTRPLGTRGSPARVAGPSQIGRLARVRRDGGLCVSEDVTAPTTGDVAELSDEEVGNLAETCADALVEDGMMIPFLGAAANLVAPLGSPLPPWNETAPFPSARSSRATWPGSPSARGSTRGRTRATCSASRSGSCARAASRRCTACSFACSTARPGSRRRCTGCWRAWRRSTPAGEPPRTEAATAHRAHDELRRSRRARVPAPGRRARCRVVLDRREQEISRGIHVGSDGKVETSRKRLRKDLLRRIERPVVVKIHGSIETDGGPNTSFVVTEDDYIDYLAGPGIESFLPVSIRTRIENDQLAVPRLQPGRLEPPRAALAPVAPEAQRLEALRDPAPARCRDRARLARPGRHPVPRRAAPVHTGARAGARREAERAEGAMSSTVTGAPREVGREPTGNPYHEPLQPFREADAASFVGRDELTELLVAYLESTAVTVVYGPSGVGKTSVLRAGVAARLREISRDSARRRESGLPAELVVVVSSWRDDPSLTIVDALNAALADAADPATRRGSRRAPARETRRRSTSSPTPSSRGFASCNASST